MKLKHSLLAKYMLIVLCAIVLLPLTFPLVAILVNYPISSNDTGQAGLYRNGKSLEAMWRREAGRLAGAPDAAVDAALRRMKEQYPKAGVFWVDGAGWTRLHLSDLSTPPADWSPADTVAFMKERTGGDPFTVVAFIGGRKEQGFMVLEVPRAVMAVPVQQVQKNYPLIYISGTLLVLGLFLFMSMLFFYRIRRRLVRLQSAMTASSASGIPGRIEAGNQDEVGRLETAFNDMVHKLEISRKREVEDEALRRDLIAKLSHDLRTPLTTISGHAYSLLSEPLTAKGRESIGLIERKIGYLGQLIDNLISYSLLSAGKYPYNPMSADIVRTARMLFAGWYPAFEREKFEIEAELPDTAIWWEIDAEWFERVLDNYFQNVLRHAKSGRYIAFRIDADSGGSIVIEDRGPGMQGGSSAEKGAGIGLSIAALMLKEMQLRADIDTGAGGTTITIRPRKASLRLN